MHWETKTFMLLTLLCYMLYCSGLEPNPQYLLGLPVLMLGVTCVRASPSVFLTPF